AGRMLTLPVTGSAAGPGVTPGPQAPVNQAAEAMSLPPAEGPARTRSASPTLSECTLPEMIISSALALFTALAAAASRSSRSIVIESSVPDHVSGTMICGQTCERSQHLGVSARVSFRLAQQMKPVRKGSSVAQKIQTVFIDDLDGSEAEGTVRFGLDGAEYEIDLNAEHARALRDALARYVQ